MSVNTDDECVAQYDKNQPIISSCELINVSKEGSRNQYFHAIIETDHINTVLTGIAASCISSNSDYIIKHYLFSLYPCIIL